MGVSCDTIGKGAANGTSQRDSGPHSDKGEISISSKIWSEAPTVQEDRSSSAVHCTATSIPLFSNDNTEDQVGSRIGSPNLGPPPLTSLTIKPRVWCIIDYPRSPLRICIPSSDSLKGKLDVTEEEEKEILAGFWCSSEPSTAKTQTGLEGLSLFTQKQIEQDRIEEEAAHALLTPDNLMWDYIEDRQQGGDACWNHQGCFMSLISFVALCFGSALPQCRKVKRKNESLPSGKPRKLESEKHSFSRLMGGCQHSSLSVPLNTGEGPS